ncbi:MAG: hypothetical protein ACR2RV_16750, partial [Verrucomicrobiales bacterium]
AYYEWWVHDIAQLDTLAPPDGTGRDGWQLLQMGLGLNQIEFTGSPELVISDKLFFVRYGEGDELKDATDASGNDLNNDPSMGVVEPESWRLVAFEQDSYAVTPPDERVPYQWAGAANSPQLQASGDKKYVPQLVMGWVKRVLDRVNPYEARFTDFLDSESPAVYSSMLQEAGAPFVGQVALNPDKDVIENVGLIQLYETVLERAKELTVGDGKDTGVSQALLLAATRLAFLYELLAREAYSDAQNPTILVVPDSGLAAAAPFIHSFYNQQSSLLQEELALLRGTDFEQSFPTYNRLFWNYVKGLGEAAYNANYRIYDVTLDGLIDESDAAQLFPQGHGDAWGHFLSSSRMHYDLLNDGNQNFVWDPKPELYSLLDNVLEVDYLDERSFARIAAAKARAGKEIVGATYRGAYSHDPDGQWQGYQDADVDRAWGVSEWANRAGQGALFDWMVGNALVPVTAPDQVDPDDPDDPDKDIPAENLDKIDRLTNEAELSEISGAYAAIQHTIDRANNGGNPLGFDNDALTFDIDPLFDGTNLLRLTHFEQVYERAVAAGQNALAAFQFANGADQQIQKTADDTLSLQIDALKQDIDYRNRLIEIFGTPYEGTIGPGKFYEEGYIGPDTAFYQYIDHPESEDYVPESDPRFVALDLKGDANSYSALNYYITTDFVKAGNVSDLFDDYYLTKDFASVGLEGSDAEKILEVEVPVLEVGDYGFMPPAGEGWGRREAYGEIQNLLNDLVAAQIEVDRAVDGYTDYVNGLLISHQRLKTELDLQAKKLANRVVFQTLINVLTTGKNVLELAVAEIKGKGELGWKGGITITEGLPVVEGAFALDVAAPARSAALSIALGGETVANEALEGLEMAKGLVEFSEELAENLHELDEATFEAFGELLEAVEHFADELVEEESKRRPIAAALQKMADVARRLESAEAEGFRLLDEREAFNIVLAGKAQRNRYSDMLLRLTRNDAIQKYQSAFEHALRYAWLTAKAYEYETNLDDNDPASALTLLEDIVQTRKIGNWVDGQPRIGKGGLAEILAQLKGNFDTLKGQLGINNPQYETERLSLRTGNFRINAGSSSDAAWVTELGNARVDDLWEVPEFVRYCRPFAERGDGAQPGLVIEFETDITSGNNAFGNPLVEGDHSFSTANFATKIRSAGVWFEGYDALSSLASSPRVYLVPAGGDRLRVSNSAEQAVREWDVVEQRIPAPFIINQSLLEDPNYIPSVDVTSGSFNDLRRFGDFRAYDADTGPDEASTSGRLFGRSVWNTR